MKKMAVTLAAALLVLPLVTPSFAETVKVVGNVTKIQMKSPDPTSATISLKDKNGKEYTVIIKDNETLGKLNKKINEGDEVRTRFDSETKVTSSFKKTAGCD
ncbi:MAG: hypothetical protein Fur0034_13370 [Desulfuromonadia bacterium]